MFFGKFSARRLGVSTVAVAVVAGGVVGIPLLATAAPNVDHALRISGASNDTNYAIPGGALFVAPNGNDRASGSRNSPLESIARAVDKAPKGGTVVLRGGLYRQSLGTVNKPVTLQAFPKERPVITGTDVVTEWKRSGATWVTTSWTTPFSQSEFRRQEIRGSHPSAGKVEQVYRNGKKLQQVSSLSAVNADSFYVDPSTKRAHIGSNPNGATMELASRQRFALFNSPAAGSKLLGLRFTAFASPHLDARAMVVSTASPFLIENSQFDNSSGAGFFGGGARLTVRKSTFEHNGSVGLAMNRTHNSVVENSRFIGNNSEGFAVSGCGGYCTIAGIKITHQDGSRIANNAVIDNDSTGLWCDLGCTRTTFEGNTLSDNTLNGIYYEVSTSGTITGNYITNSKIGIKLAGADSTTVTGNQLVNNSVQLGVYDDARHPSFDDYSHRQKLTWNTKNLVLSNNILHGGRSTTKQLDTNATDQVAAPQMFKSAYNNRVSGNQNFWWCKAKGNCAGYSNINAFSSVSKLAFGVGPAQPTGTKPPTPTKSPTQTKSPAPVKSSPAPASPKTMVDDRFERSTTSWNSFGQATVALSTTGARNGRKSLQVKPTNSSEDVVGASLIPADKAIAGQTYTGSCWVKSTSPAPVQVRFHEYDSKWKQVAAAHDGQATTTQRSDYHYKVSVVYTAKHTGSNLAFIVYSTALTAKSAPVYIDDCTISAV